MLRQCSLATIFIIATLLASSVSAQTFTNVITFGDSLSDSGNVASTDSNLAEGTSYTTNPDPVAFKTIAKAFGFSGDSSANSGSNYAWGGACMNTGRPCAYTSPHIPQQIDSYLSRPGANMKADPNALYTIWGGGNDIESTLGRGVAPAYPTDTIAAATANVANIVKLKTAGARYIVVYNMPNIGLSPNAIAQGAAAQAALTSLSAAYNQALYTGLRQTEDGIIPMNVAALFSEIVDDVNSGQNSYGINDVTNPACQPGTSNALQCGPAGSTSTEQYAAGTNRNHLFADGQHPSGIAHDMIAQSTLSTLSAPVQVSLAGEAGIDVIGIHSSTVLGELWMNSGLDKMTNSTNGFASVNINRYKASATPRLGENKVRASVVTLGSSYQVTSTSYITGALSIGRHKNSVSQASINSDIAVASATGTWLRGEDFYISSGITLGTNSTDITRSILLGTATRNERGATASSLYGLTANFGWMLKNAEQSTHGPYFGASWTKQKIKGYRENGEQSTAMNFSGFNRDSLIIKAGYHFSNSIGQNQKRKLYSRFTFEKELKDNAVEVTGASNTTMPGKFTLAGFQPPKHWATIEVGLQMPSVENSEFIAGYSGQFGSNSRVNHRIEFRHRTEF